MTIYPEEYAMLSHPFLVRISAERRILKTINGSLNVTILPLPGLAPKTIDRWVSESLPPYISATQRETLRVILVDVSRRLRLGSAASHRGVLSDPLPSERSLDQELGRIQQVLAELSSENDRQD
jgi:hypothetical protein